jgi:hypothetical protein
MMANYLIEIVTKYVPIGHNWCAPQRRRRRKKTLALTETKVEVQVDRDKVEFVILGRQKLFFVFKLTEQSYEPY